MYIPTKLVVSDIHEIHHFIDNHGFGLIVGNGSDHDGRDAKNKVGNTLGNHKKKGIEGTHLPFILNKEEGEYGTLYCHFARINPHWTSLAGEEALVVFHGPHAYISPTWYASEPNVPTWNYTAVHVYGELTVLSDEQTVEVMEKTVKKYEPQLWDNQRVMPTAYRDKLQKAVVACKITLTCVEAQYKLGQQRRDEDQQGVVEGLSQCEDLDSIGLLNFMQQTRIGIGNV